MFQHDFAVYNIALHEKFGGSFVRLFRRPPIWVGPVVRHAPNRYSINDVEATKIILGHHNALDKSKYYTAFADPNEGTLFSKTNVKVHAKLRRPIA